MSVSTRNNCTLLWAGPYREYWFQILLYTLKWWCISPVFGSKCLLHWLRHFVFLTCNPFCLYLTGIPNPLPSSLRSSILMTNLVLWIGSPHMFFFDYDLFRFWHLRPAIWCPLSTLTSSFHYCLYWPNCSSVASSRYHTIMQCVN